MKLSFFSLLPLRRFLLAVLTIRLVILPLSFVFSAVGITYGSDSLFTVQTHTVPGRPVQILAANFHSTANSQRNGFIVVVVSGSPPTEKRQLVLFSASPLPPVRTGEAASEAASIDMPPDVVAFDFGNVDSVPGDEIVLLSASAFRILHPFTDTPPHEIAVQPTLPLPVRTRGLSRLPFLGDWNGLGAVEALVPTLSGAALIPLHAGSAQEKRQEERLANRLANRIDLSLPLLAEYQTPDTRPPITPEFLTSTTTWPTLMQADHNGDGRLDLFALSRFAVWIYYAEATGLSPTPVHQLDLRLFSPAEELRPHATSTRAFARDLDADGLADLVIHRTAGSILSSRSAIDIYRNPGSGIQPALPPQLQLTTDDAFSTIDLVDLDSNGHVEILETQFFFGIAQALRLLTTRRAALDFRILTLQKPDLSQAVPSWKDTLTLRLNFSQGRAEGLLPTAAGDWNDDGKQDLLYGLDKETLAIHLGVVSSEGPGFGSRKATQTVPEASDGVVVDYNGDGLDDLILFDPRDPSGAVHILLNKDTLPGTH